MKNILVPIGGTLKEILVRKGDKVKKGDTVAIMESMKMEIHIESEYNGEVNDIFLFENDSIKMNESLIELK